MGHRIRRVNATLQQVLAETIGDLKDPRIGFVTVTEVRTSPDLHAAEVFFTVLPDTEQARTATLEGLRSAAPLLRRELARLRLRTIPHLAFILDPVPGQGRRIDQLLDQTRAPHGME